MTRRLLPLFLLLLAACGGYLRPGGAAPWCYTRSGEYDCTAATAERDSLRADSVARDTTGGR